MKKGVKIFIMGGLPWWRSGWESTCQCRGHGFKPWSGKIPHAVEQLSPWATATEPARLEPVLRNKRGRDSERPAHRDEEWPPLAATRESPRTETKTQRSQILKKKKKKIFKKPMGCSKSISKREVYSYTIIPQETRNISNKQPNLTPKAIRERRTKNPQS